MDRDTFLQRVRTAAGAGRAYRLNVPEVPATVGYQGAGPDPVARLAQEINAVGGFATIVDDLPAARNLLRDWILQHLPPAAATDPPTNPPRRSALCWEHPLLDRLELADLLASLDIDCWTHGRLAPLPDDQQRSAMLGVDLCISSVTYAVAETGTLAVCSAPGQERGGSLLGPIHIAVVESSQVLPDLFDLFSLLDPTRLPSNLSLITGPSKTGDIELELTTGVHGPGLLLVLILR